MFDELRFGKSFTSKLYLNAESWQVIDSKLGVLALTLLGGDFEG